MTQHTRTLTANGAVTFNLFNNRKAPEGVLRNISVEGTFDGGTVTLTSKKSSTGASLPVNDAGGTQITFIDNGQINFNLPGGGGQNPVILEATLAGSTSPDLEVILDDGI